MNDRIFIIEDDANILYGLESQFSDAGLEVETSSGDESLEGLLFKLKTFDPSYIVLDLILPKIDGFEVIKKIKGDQEMSDREIFVFTDFSDEDAKQRSLRSGADYVFFKEEFDSYEFAEKIKKIISNQAKIKDDEASGGEDYLVD
jgi:DNA-binding response OmpR family regulator